MKSLLLTVAEITVAASLGVLIACPALADPPRYTIKNIHPIPEDAPFLHTFGVEMNNAAQVAGETSEETAFLYDDRDGSLIGIGPLHFAVTDINELGVVVGYDREVPRVHLDEDGVTTDISEFEGTSPISLSGGINDAGEVVGHVDPLPEDWVFHAFLYADGTMRLLDLSVDQGSCIESEAHDINNAGQIVGRISMPTDSGCTYKAFLHQDGETLLIGDLLPDENTSAIKINEAGQVIVDAQRTGAYLYSDGELQRIGDESTIAIGLNNSGWVVGATGEERHAFAYIDGELYDLNDLVTDLTGWEHLNVARDINDSGQITGNGLQRIDPDGNNVAFLLTPLDVKVKIDIRPGNRKNRINLRSKGNIAVAVLSTRTFDATQVDWETVTFGPRQARERHQRIHLRDVGKDGDMDAVLHFKIRKTGIRCHDKTVTLTGETFDGQEFTGTDKIKVVKCRR